MGLDFSHGDAHWSYGGFMWFRKRLAKEIGVNIDEMVGFAPSPYLAEISAEDWATLGFGSKPTRFNTSWDEVNDAIVPLLRHSDCDGDLSVEECRAIAPRLRELVQGWSDDPELDEAFDKKQALLLADGLEQCVRQGQRLEFC